MPALVLPHRLAPLVASLVPVVILVGSCTAPTVDVSPIVLPVTKAFNDLGLTVADIECPPKVEQAVGSSFQCTVLTDKGAKAPVTVTQTGEGDQVRLTWVLGKDVVVLDKHLPGFTAYAHTVSPDLTVSCPKAVVLAGGTGKVVCDVKDSKGQTGKLNVTMTDGAPSTDQSTWSIDQ